MRAERNKRAKVLETEGTKLAEINQAEGEKQAQILKAEGEAEARLRVAEAEAEAIRKITAVVASEKGDTVNYLLAVRYIDTLKEMVEGKDNKVVYLPYEATGILSSIGGIKELFEKK